MGIAKEAPFLFLGRSCHEKQKLCKNGQRRKRGEQNMKEQLYTIPVNEAFDSACECPICRMRHTLEENALEFTLGPSYMEDDVRMVTDRIGFCERHVEALYQRQNRLGLALMLKTHADRILREAERLSGGFKTGKGGLWKRNRTEETHPLAAYLGQLETGCFVCNRIGEVMERYLATVFYLYEHEEEFRQKVRRCKGFCNGHYRLLLNEAGKQLGTGRAEEFCQAASEAYLEGMKRVRDDLSWFIDKFDYRYVNEPWKNAKDALQRMMLKQNGVFYSEETQKQEKK